MIERIGGRQPIAVDTRIVCATHQDLDAMIADGPLPRGPLLPSRRDRGEDPLACRAVGRCGPARAPFRQPLRTRAEPGRPVPDAPTRSTRSIAYGWPGNVRELENRIKRAVIMADGKSVTAADLDLAASNGAAGEQLPINLRAAREVADRKAIRHAMSRSRQQYLGRRQAARDQPPDALRSAQAVSSERLSFDPSLELASKEPVRTSAECSLASDRKPPGI